VDPTKAPGIRISQIFLARALFEHSAEALELPPTTPLGEVDTLLNVSAAMDQNERIGMFSVAVETNPESKGLYRFHMEIAAVVECDADSNMPLREYLRTAGPPTLYPFVREAIANITGRGRFGPVWLHPTNFTALTQNIRFTDEEDANKNSEK
jgi:preprotein translocase subunit SecB